MGRAEGRPSCGGRGGVRRAREGRTGIFSPQTLRLGRRRFVATGLQRRALGGWRGHSDRRSRRRRGRRLRRDGPRATIPGGSNAAGGDRGDPAVRRQPVRSGHHPAFPRRGRPGPDRPTRRRSPRPLTGRRSRPGRTGAGRQLSYLVSVGRFASGSRVNPGIRRARRISRSSARDGSGSIRDEPLT